ncbi:MAG TPA: hypothetical protein PLD22_04555 [Bacillota bacterium]|nr:hypothetical protein [Bacillota bacterium]
MALSGCSPDPVEEDVARGALQSHFDEIVTDGFMTAVGDLLEYTIDEEVERESSKELDTFVFTVTTVGNGGLATGHMYMDYFEPRFQEVAKYRVQYSLRDKEWVLDGIDKMEQISCTPLDEIREDRFLEELEFKDKIEATLVSQDADLANGISIVTVDAVKEQMLVTKQGRMTYTFEFDKDRKIWENTRTEEIGEWNHTYTFAKHRDWMYETSPDEYGGKTYVGLKVEYDKDANQVKLQWAGGYVDKYGYGSNRTETFTWYGKPSPEDPLVFISDADSKKFKIVNDGTAVNWDGYTFYKVK